MARIEVTPVDGLSDGALSIRVRGLRAGRRVTLWGRAELDFGSRWESEATFVADGPTLDLASAAPVAGSYGVAHPMGLLFSMGMTDPGAMPEAPALWRANDFGLRIEGDVDGAPLDPVTALRRCTAPGVIRADVRDDGLVASLFRPPGTERRPVVITLPGSGGGLAEGSAALLAAHGYVGVALAYFGIESLPAGLVSIPLEYFERAYAWLRAQPFADADRVAVMGVSRGGELALLLGATFPWVRAVIGYVPSGVTYAGVSDRRTESPPTGWTYRGAPLPSASFDPSRVDYGAAEIALTPGFRGGLEDADAVRRAEIPVERTRGPILMISGGDDQMWPSPELSEIAVRRLRAYGFAHPFEHVRYEGAGHTIAPPWRPTTVRARRHPVVGQVFGFGGSPLANARACEDSWRRILELLDKTFGAGRARS